MARECVWPFRRNPSLCDLGGAQALISISLPHRRYPGGRPVVLLAGLTGSGKTAVALALAKSLAAEVVSADSRQVYQGLCVGTAKPHGNWVREEEGIRYQVQGVVHHLVDHVAPTDFYSAGRFVREASDVVRDLEKRGRCAVVVGGTGLYFRSLVRGLAPLPEANPLLRQKLADRAEKEGRGALHAELAQVDPLAAQSISPNNLHRLIRALEVYRLTGRPLTELQREGTLPAPWAFQWFGLEWDPLDYRTHLKRRCAAMAEGLLEETRALLAHGVPSSAPAFQSLGYREALAHLAGELSREDFETKLFDQTRLYAKRQATWFRSEREILWIKGSSHSDPALLAKKIDSLLLKGPQSSRL